MTTLDPPTVDSQMLHVVGSDAETFDLPLPLVSYTVYDYSPAQGLAVMHPLLIESGDFLASPYTEGFITTVSAPSGPVYYIDLFQPVTNR